MGDEKKFDKNRDELSKEEMQAMEIMQKVYDHELTAFGGLMAMLEILDEEEKKTPDAESAEIPIGSRQESLA